MPAYSPEPKPAEGVWSPLKRTMATFMATGLHDLTRIIKRKLKGIHY